MARRIIECVPNFSEGRNPETVARIADAVTSVPGVALIGKESDPDHNRSVLTIAGPPEAVSEAAFRAVQVAVQCIDLRCHQGVHPRLGAADVVPFVPILNTTLEECAAYAHTFGRRVWNELQVPVYFYESAALSEDRRRLENVRRGGFEKVCELVRQTPERRPDLGGPDLHPSAGAVIAGARKFLLAFNVNLDTEDVAIARAIAVKIRASSGGLPHVKAMGVLLASRNLAQVSMNLTDFEVTPLHVVFEAVEREAALRGVRIAGSEVIGLMPATALAMAAAHALRIENFHSRQILENRLLSNLID
ncbi:MAG: glutamate formimidoyltransferase [Bryobacterales bacterium]|nr:glutamate formimidoyltransferase [Bryobacterales bacterium]